ncbi:MAG: hypothetical protein HXY25_02535, partial [Alphaproteobacteria bacterium]|nr:hypothetical protein [Alphaproteobacteria bacterium]
MRRPFLPGLKLAAEIVSALVAALAVGLAALAVVLAQGPLSLDRFVPRLQSHLAAAWPTMPIAFEHAELAWMREARVLRLVLREVTVGEPGPDASASGARFPRVEIELGAAGLRHGVLAPSLIRIEGASARWGRDEAGTARLALDAPAADTPG